MAITSFTLSYEAMIAMASFIVALAALIRSHSDARFARKTAEMSVKPYLTVNVESSHPEGEYVALLSNHGVGPAFISSFSIYSDGKEVVDKKHYDNFLERALCDLNLETKNFTTSSYSAKSAVPVGSVETLLRVQLHSDNLPSTSKVKSELNRLDLRIEYSDIYGNQMEPLDTRQMQERF